MYLPVTSATATRRIEYCGRDCSSTATPLHAGCSSNKSKDCCEPQDPPSLYLIMNIQIKTTEKLLCCRISQELEPGLIYMQDQISSLSFPLFFSTFLNFSFTSTYICFHLFYTQIIYLVSLLSRFDLCCACVSV